MSFFPFSTLQVYLVALWAASEDLFLAFSPTKIPLYTWQASICEKVIIFSWLIFNLSAVVLFCKKIPKSAGDLFSPFYLILRTYFISFFFPSPARRSNRRPKVYWPSRSRAGVGTHSYLFPLIHWQLTKYKFWKKIKIYIFMLACVSKKLESWCWWDRLSNGYGGKGCGSSTVPCN